MTRLVRLMALVIVLAPGISLAVDCGSGSNPYKPNCECGEKVKGTFTLSGTLSCNCSADSCLRTYQGATIRGSGTMTRTLSTPKIAIAVEGVTGVTIEDITIDGNFQYGIHADGGTVTVNQVTLDVDDNLAVFADGGTIDMDNRGLTDGTNPVSGITTTGVWLRADAGTLDFFTDIPGVCCCKVTEANGGDVTLYVNGDDTTPVACTANCGGCC